MAELALDHRGMCNGVMNGQKWQMDTRMKAPRTLDRHYLDKILIFSPDYSFSDASIPLLTTQEFLQVYIISG